MMGGQNPRRHPHTAFRSQGEDGGLVVLPTRHEVKVLNEVGARIFDLLDGSRSQAQIARMIADEFDVSVDQANRDVAAFLDELRQAGMVSDEPEASGPGEVH